MPPKGNKRARASEGSSRGEDQGVAPCVRNREFATRRAILTNRPIIYERGIQVHTLEGTSIPDIVRSRNWENFVRTPNLANMTMVREFYASMVPAYFRNRGCVLVRDVVVEITERTINAHFGTAPVSQNRLPLGFTHFEEGPEALARLLRRNDNGVWNKKHPIRQSDLSKDMALMNRFNSTSLRPVSHTSSIPVMRAELLACYLTGAPMDVGRIIKAEINEGGEIDLKDKKQAVKKIIPFPCLISTLCREAGVPELDGDEIAKGDKGDLNVRSWNDTASKTKGRRKLWTAGSSSQAAAPEPEESEEEDEDFEPQDEEEFDFGDSQPAGSLGKSEFDQIMQALTNNRAATERVEGKVDTLSKQFQDYMKMQEYYREEREAEDEDIRADVAAVRAQLGYQTYVRRQRRSRPPPPSSTLGFSAGDYVPDDVTPADIERMRRGENSGQ